MSYKDVETPEELMEKIELRLRKHTMRRKRKRVMITSMSLIILVFILSNQPIIGFASKLYLGFFGGIEKAIDYNNSSSINEVLTHEDLTLTFKELVADETGFAITGEFNKEGYNLESFEVYDETGKRRYPSPIMTSNKGKEIVLFFPPLDAKKMILKVTKIRHMEEDNDKEFIVDWEVPIDVVMQKTKVLPLNKKIELDEGTIVLEDLVLGVKASEINYRFVPKSGWNTKHIGGIYFYIHNKKERYNSLTERIADLKEYFTGKIIFDPLIYDQVKRFEIIVGGIDYKIPINKELVINHQSLPLKVDILGSEAYVTSMDFENNETMVKIELGTKNRSYKRINVGIDSVKEQPEGDYSFYTHVESIETKDLERDKSILEKHLGLVSHSLSDQERENYINSLTLGESMVEFVLPGEQSELILMIDSANNFKIYAEKVDINISWFKILWNRLFNK